MLIDTQSLKGFHLKAEDGEIGKVINIFFDDKIWAVRYIIVRTGRFMTGKEVLIAPESVREVDLEEKLLHVSMTMQKVKDSPNVDTRMPVSRRKELEIFSHYGWVPYWHPPMTPLETGFGSLSPAGEEKTEEAFEDQDPNLRDAEAVTGYRVEAADGQIGHVEGFLADDRSWVFRNVIVDTRNWLPGGRKVLFPVDLATGFFWEERKMGADLTVKKIQESPEYDPSQPVDREFEKILFSYFGQPGYWNPEGRDDHQF